MKIKMYAYAELVQDYYAEPAAKKISYTVWPCQSEIWNGVYIGETEVDMPDIDLSDLINGTITNSKAEQQRLRSECQIKINNIEQQIQELQCIELKE